MRIVVFKNSYKDTDKHPDYIIYRSEEDQDLEKIGALWLGKSSKGKSYMSGEIELDQQVQNVPEPPHDEFGGDDIPF